MIDFDAIKIGEIYEPRFLADMWGYKDYRMFFNKFITPRGDNKIVLFVNNRSEARISSEFIAQFNEDTLTVEPLRRHNPKHVERLISSYYSDDEVHLFTQFSRYPSKYKYEGKVFFANYCEDTNKLIFKSSKMESLAFSSFLTEQETHGFFDNTFTPSAEGKKKIIQHISYERSPRNRARAIEIHGTKCKVCGFDFNERYGKELARDYIEVHHVIPITDLAGHELDIENDLIPLCSNCHSMIHRGINGILSVEALKNIIKQVTLNNSGTKID